MNRLNVRRFLFTGVEEANVFIASCTAEKKAVVIDAGGFDDSIIKYLKDNILTIEFLFITHNHYDHAGHIREFLELNPDIRLIAGSESVASNVHVPGDGELFKLGELSGYVHHVPGHTDDMIVLSLHNRLFTGDALFAGAVGGTSSEENYHRQVAGIKKSLLDYPDETIIHPGHGPDSTIGLEKMFNPFLNHMG